MGKKRNQANKNIETLINEYVGVVEMLNRPNCVNRIFILVPHEEVECIRDCEICKEQFYEELREKLIERYIVK